MITKEEQRIRKEAAEFALASVQLEGFKVSAQTLRDTERYIQGEITIADLIEAQHRPLEPCFMDDGEPLEPPTLITLPRKKTRSC
ncbi:antitoxin VbhA family protein [Alcaligenes faecalis subsp. faecalis]|uniref:antitoxin VbhA family protein n=1 Tax=Alcaligenes faecalis TaxID=511 RepID=UPI001F1D9BD2|nr:antitoxin VbhA family protein [Alcaligenes faecalis]MBW4790667.1 antitoxin VbhA family protein [Alcaligenes faecalis subsp. faecalis]